jgi:hypothetical protein
MVKSLKSHSRRKENEGFSLIFFQKRRIIMQISKKDMEKLEKAFAPSPWLQRAINRFYAMETYPDKETRRKILAEERARG